MADHRHRPGYPQQNRTERPEDRQHHQHNAPPSHPRTSSRGSARSSDSESSRPRASSAMATSVTLPSIHDARPGGFGAPPPPQLGRPYSGDPRYASPNAVNGYPPPSVGQPAGGAYLPPLQPQADPRMAGYSAAEQRLPYYDERRAQVVPQPPPAHHGYHDAYAADLYYRGHPQGHPQGAAAGAYPQAHQAYGQEYGQSGGDRPREAPRQRTSIACRYCRKRKIRCSGHQNAPGGKCQNCARMNQECIFQPVSSSSSTAFIPVSAVPGGVPPGTQLFGAYGQPLAPSAVPPMPPHQPYPPTGPGGPPHHGGYYHHPLPSPTDPYPPYGDEQVTGRRRRRTPEEREEGYRLPPPRSSGIPEEDSRRRSPAEFSNHSSPGGLPYHRYPDQTNHSPRNPTLPHPATGRSPTMHSGSSGSSTPAKQGAPVSQGQAASIMSLSNLVEKTDIDKTMIDRLNRPRDGHAGVLK